MPEDIVFYAVGDIAPDRPDPETIFEHVSGMLNQADIVFGQLEAVLSERGTVLPQARVPCRGKPAIARVLREVGFDVVSFASNHCMDLGREAFADTLDVLRREGPAVIGVGENIAVARQPAIVERRGTRVGLLAYSSILPQGYWAEQDRPGCVPLRAFTVYEQIEHDQPGTPCRVHTYPHRGDRDAMIQDIRRAKAMADIVVVSMHWGIHFAPAMLADYQRDLAHVAVDAGADLVVGTHAHILKGLEVYAGKAIFYSLCNFALELRPDPSLLVRQAHREVSKLNSDWGPDPDYPTYFMPRDSRKTVIVKCAISNRQIQRVSFLPVYINKQAQPEVLRPEDALFGEVVTYMQEISRSQGLETCLNVSGGEVVVSTTQQERLE